MTKYHVSALGALMLICNLASAQTNVLARAIEQINHYQNVSFKQSVKQKNPGDGSWTTSYYNFWASRNADGTEYNKSTGKYGTTVFQGTTKISLDPSQKTYSIKRNHDLYEETPYYWAKQFQEKLSKMPEKIRNMPDTVINQAACAHVEIIKSDTIGARFIEDFYLNKQTSLPVFIRQFMEGNFSISGSKASFSSVMINEFTYSDYRVNDKNFEDLAKFTIPAGFSPEQKIVPLAVNDKAPDWQLADTHGKTVSNKQLLGSIVLLDFSSNTCGPCIMALPAMKNLLEKYGQSGVKIYSINTSDSKTAVKAFITKNHISYPVLLDGAKVSKAFKITGTPYFFVIDAQGNIAKIFDGYDDGLERRLTKAIDKLQKGS
ncbi:peroxiredoxin [Mucilaginibacter yixingensis]|uniref:Peroxiredoxin n=1 Tax=Mucilaginibacter yixingensis TaxID=1295612 RepID=A0A2T5J564_9SPHI|nr:TlpA disulfide reductase family protein [Mucilaginibacter yixingensis]PTQ92701.1 peroxiredoxin [Mucilaginibacter yixingensis]